MKVAEIRRKCVEKLRCAEIERPEYVTDIFLSRVLNISRPLLITKYDDELSADESGALYAMCEKRAKRVPLSYIIGESEFYGRIFKVGNGSLIPRPETELLAEALLKLVPNAEKFADWCTGSGCIGITLLLEMPRAVAYGIDSSADALKWAEANSSMYDLGARFSLICESEPLICPIEPGSLDFIVSNPPYIPSSEIAGLMSDVRDYEPHEALDGGADGLDIYRKLILAASLFLKPGGYFAVETGGDLQSGQLLKIVGGNFSLSNKIYDYNGILRHLIWQVF